MAWLVNHHCHMRQWIMWGKCTSHAGTSHAGTHPLWVLFNDVVLFTNFFVAVFTWILISQPYHLLCCKTGQTEPLWSCDWPSNDLRPQWGKIFGNYVHKQPNQVRHSFKGCAFLKILTWVTFRIYLGNFISISDAPTYLFESGVYCGIITHYTGPGEVSLLKVEAEEVPTG